MFTRDCLSLSEKHNSIHYRLILNSFFKNSLQRDQELVIRFWGCTGSSSEGDNWVFVVEVSGCFSSLQQ